jgi:transcriptional regulator with XRE-family HTH domain
MSISIGHTIKRLRKERNLTQEALAEQLNVTFQAVSKWENETGLPDISQIVPLASVFGVSTDILFGTFGTNDAEEVQTILAEVTDLKSDGSADSIKCAYDALLEGLIRHPNNLLLMGNCLEIGNALAHPESTCYDEVHGYEFYRECVRQANIIISYDKNACNVLRAHMIMVLLHSAYGDREAALEHANNFPERSDMTANAMAAHIAHAEKNYSAESLSCRRDFMYHFEAMFDAIVQIGETYRLMGKYDDALRMFFSIFSMSEVIFAGERFMPQVHCREQGDVHVFIARTYIEMNDTENALCWLEKMVEYDTDIRSCLKNDMFVETPFLRDVRFPFCKVSDGNKRRLLQKLNGAEFESLRNNNKFVNLLNIANAMND